ncbi:iron-sulfur cluster-binding protein [Gottschalkia acidurici 9a]|uniref:Iron-sulfur cluster-binding protein n=1 Tax=Gottschalkia acidurici (strain ATCC 7906 / DSM 604 / BCRC 14475 / CIP 104303 / KCTC 5404 / NCIMB 10678 / 9a) TaxID=1128398 RepID=K0B0J9_GOTA9|nr:ASKHA domain-containing protein [Gottschalkia acidurici]AFS78171.1 iron-sulfur cluster-binding protein [Gottschalkia acidurici 9a]
MAKITFKDKSTTIEVEEGISLVECIRQADFSIETPCNGMGTCGKCKIEATGKLSAVMDKEKEHIKEGSSERLACLTTVLGDVEIKLTDKYTALKTINEGYSIDVKLNSDMKIIDIPLLDRTSSIPYVENLKYEISSNILEKISDIDKNNYEDIKAVLYKDKIIDIEQSLEKLFGVAIDIGTTGISAYLVDIRTGETLNKKSSLNPQTEYGGDVLSRITYSISTSEGKENLKRSIVNKINKMILELVKGEENIKYVYRVIVAANTVMLHMLLGIDTETIAKSPYRPVFIRKLDIKGKDMGIKINEEGIVTILPSASGYVGADIVSGAIATAFNRKKHNAIFIDIGTNGEILVISNGKVVGTSTAAGPAFEGMNISCGCRAESGAIDTFIIENENVKFTTINNESPKGICGSGLIDIASELVNNKVILKSGKLNNKLEGELGEKIRDKKFYITDEIYISQADIRQIQLAKGAIAAGITMILQSINLSIDQIEEVVVAGSFGYHLNPESIRRIGIIPKGFKGKISFTGNSSVEGAKLSLINKDIIKDMIRLKDEIEVLELSMKEEFQECFVKELSF